MNLDHFVRTTIGLEVWRACGFLGDTSIAAAFDALEHSGAAWVEIRWWLDGQLWQMQRYELSDPAYKVLPGPGVGTGAYEPDGELPPGPGHELEVAVYPRGVSPTDRELVAFAPMPDTARKACAMVDLAIGLVVLS